MNKVFADLQATLKKRFKVELPTIGMNTPLSEFGLDSLDQLELLFELEEKYGVQVDARNGDLNTAGDVVRLFEDAIGALQP